jgi:streptomycin 6-kinase
MSSLFEENALSWGPGGAEWLSNIPDIITEYEQRWSVKVQAPCSLNYNYVALAERADGTLAVLKIGFPKDREFQTEINALEVFDGKGINRLLEADREKAVILIERVVPGEPLSALIDDDEATRLIVSAMKKLHRPLPENHNFITPLEWSNAIPELREKCKGSTEPLPAYLVDAAETLFEELIASSADPVLVHGDLHHDNILHSYTKGWVVIDPKGVAAEPAYEVAAMIRNPYEKLKSISNLQPLLDRRLTILADELGIDRPRLHQWCLAQTVLSAVWSVGGPEGPEHAIRVAETLYKMGH